MTLIVGLCGAARSGKDTFATMLAEEYGRPHVRIQVAGPLKAYLRNLFDWTEEHTDGALKDVPDPRYPLPCPACVEDMERGGRDEPGQCGCCDNGFIGLTPRHAMQQLGGEFAQSTFPAIYATRAAREAERGANRGKLAMITDCRFLHDIQAVKAVGGTIIEIGRDGDEQLKGDAAEHSGETARFTPEFQALVDIHIHNKGSLGDLRTLAVITADGFKKAQQVEGVDPRLVPGCWIKSKRFGSCVLISVNEGFYNLRYKARHLATQQIIWVGSTDESVMFIRPADEESKYVLTLEGAYGLGIGIADPRFVP